MLAQERYNYICDLLQKQRTVKVTQLSKSLKVTCETVRRDLEHLESAGKLSRVHGGATMLRFETMQSSFDARLQVRSEKKDMIASKAVEFINEGNSIVLDHSTSCLALAKKLKDSFEYLTVVTNSLQVLNTLCDVPTFQIIFCGGHFHSAEKCCFGEYSKQTISKLNTDISFIGVGGISLNEGFTETFYQGVDMLKLFLKCAQYNVVLADSSKFDSVTLYNICKLSDVDVIITDNDAEYMNLDRYRDDIDIAIAR